MAAATTARADADARVGVLRSIEHEVGMLLRRARRATADRATRVHPEMHPAAYLMLATIAASGPVRGSDLGCTLSIDKASVSRYAQHLIDLGLLDRTPDPEDGRATLLSISDEGRERIDALDDARRRSLDDRFSTWSTEDLAEVAGAFARYNATFEGLDPHTR